MVCDHDTVLGLIELRRRRLQFFLIGVIVTLISYLVAMINGLGLGLNVLAGSALKNLDADAIAYADTAGLSVIRSELSAETIDRVLSDPAVREGAPLGYVAANVRTADGDIENAAFLGYDPGTIAEPEVVEGRPLEPGELDGMLADREFLRLTGYRLGDVVPVSLRLQTREYRIVGVIDEGFFFFQPAVYILRDAWRSLRYGDSAGAPEASVVLLKGDGLPGLRGDGFEVVDKGTAFANIEGVAGQQSTVSALQAFGYLIGTLVIGVFFYVLTLQKVPHIGVLKALGASSGYVFRQLLVQVVVIASLAVMVAVPLALVTGRLIQRLPNPVPIAFDGRTLLFTTVLLLAASIVGAAFSLRRILTVDPVIALGQQQ